jgi:hypothetical protein
LVRSRALAFLALLPLLRMPFSGRYRSEPVVNVFGQLGARASIDECAARSPAPLRVERRRIVFPRCREIAEALSRAAQIKVREIFSIADFDDLRRKLRPAVLLEITA